MIDVGIHWSIGNVPVANPQNDSRSHNIYQALWSPFPLTSDFNWHDLIQALCRYLQLLSSSEQLPCAQDRLYSTTTPTTHYPALTFLLPLPPLCSLSIGEEVCAFLELSILFSVFDQLWHSYFDYDLLKKEASLVKVENTPAILL